MNFLGMGPPELLMILVLALIVFGPGELPKMAGKIGKMIGDLRRTTTELSSEFHRTLSLELEEREGEAKPATTEAAPEAPAAPAAVAAETPAAVDPVVAPVAEAPAPSDGWVWDEPPANQPGTNGAARDTSRVRST